jgi:hypothetical protein
VAKKCLNHQQIFILLIKKIARYLQQVSIHSQNIKGIFRKKFTFLYGYSQIWLKLVLNDGQFRLYHKIGKMVSFWVVVCTVRKKELEILFFKIKE